MSVRLPAWPRGTVARPIPVSAGSDLSSPLGGPTQRINRMGDRMALEAKLPMLDYKTCGGVWSSRLSVGRLQGVIVTVPPMLLRKGTTGAFGAPVVDGAGQTGLTLNLRGLPVGYPFVEDQLFSFVANGVTYLNQVTADVAADGAGKVALPLLSMLRVSPADATAIEIDAPEIEGLIARDYPKPYVTRRGWASFETFIITENR